jgi:hypothetical protein
MGEFNNSKIIHHANNFRIKCTKQYPSLSLITHSLRNKNPSATAEPYFQIKHSKHAISILLIYPQLDGEYGNEIRADLTVCCYMSSHVP